MNIRDRRAIHHAANERLEHARDPMNRILLIYLGISIGLSLASSLLSVFLSDRIANTGGLGNMGLRSILSTGQTILPLVQALVVVGLEIGYCMAAMRVSRSQDVSVDILRDGFHHFFPMLRAIILQGLVYSAVGMMCMYLSAYIFVMLPVSARFHEIIAPMLQSVTALSSNVTLDEATIMQAAEAMLPVFWIFAVLFLLLFIPLSYQYRMVMYRIIDQPRPGAFRALYESRMMMRRNRFALLKLDLTFWWFYLLQFLSVAICYGDILLPMLGITLPFSATASYFMFLITSLALQFFLFYFAMNKVAVTYAVVYESLLPKKTPVQPPVPANNPWQDQY